MTSRRLTQTSTAGRGGGVTSSLPSPGALSKQRGKADE